MTSPDLLTVEQIRERVQQIGIAGDQDSGEGHISEDILYSDTLRAIAGGAANPAELAEAALASEALEFTRYYS